MSSANDSGHRGKDRFEDEATAPRRPSSPERIEVTNRSAGSGDNAVTPLFQSDTERARATPTPEAPRRSSPPRKSGPPRPSSSLSAGRVIGALVALLVACGLGIAVVALLDTSGDPRAAHGKQFLDQLSWASVYEYFFPPGK